MTKDDEWAKFKDSIRIIKIAAWLFVINVIYLNIVASFWLLGIGGGIISILIVAFIIFLILKHIDKEKK